MSHLSCGNSNSPRTEVTFGQFYHVSCTKQFVFSDCSTHQEMISEALKQNVKDQRHKSLPKAEVTSILGSSTANVVGQWGDALPCTDCSIQGLQTYKWKSIILGTRSVVKSHSYAGRILADKIAQLYQILTIEAMLVRIVRSNWWRGNR